LTDNSADNSVVDASGWIMALHSGFHAPSARKTDVFLAPQIPRDFVMVQHQKTQQTINASLPPVMSFSGAP